MSDIRRDRERLPNTTFNARYPFNRVTVTEGGHEVHLDDTPGNRRIRIAHASGTYEEISEDGRRVRVTVGNNHDYTKGGSTVTSDGNSDTRINGHSRISGTGGIHSEIAGDITLGAGKDIVVYSGAKIKIGGATVYIGASGDVEINAEGGTLSLLGKKVIIHGDTVSIGAATYLGQGSKGGTSGDKVEVTTDIPSQRTYAER